MKDTRAGKEVSLGPPTEHAGAGVGASAAGRRRFKLVHKLVLAFLAFAIVPLVATSAINARSSREVEEILSSRTKTMAATRADTIDGILFELYGDAQAFGTNEVVLDRAHWYETEEQGNRVVTAMNRYVALDDRYFLTIMVDVTGKVVAVNSKGVDGRPIDSAFLYKKSFADAPWFQAVSRKSFTTKQPYALAENQKATGTYVEDASIDPDVKAAVRGSDGFSIGFSAPVMGAEGKVIGYWMNRAKFALVDEVVTHFYREQKSGGRAGTSITILNEKGAVLLDYDPSSKGGSAISHDPSVILRPADRSSDAVVKDVLDGKSGNVRHVGPNGQDLLSGYVRSRGANGFPGMNWSYIVRVPREQAVGALIAQDQALRLVYGVAFVLVAVIGFFAARRMAAPVVTMTLAAKELSRGNVEQKLDHVSGDELGELADALRGVFEFTRNVAASVNGIANGDLDVAVEKRSDSDVLSDSVLRAKSSLRALIGEVDGLIEAARAGRLDVRSEGKGLEGVYRRLTDGMNDVMEAFGGPLADMKEVIERVAERDLTARMKDDYAGDYAAVAAAMNRALHNVESTLAGVSGASDNVANAASEISTGSQSLSQAATEQASTLEEVTSNLQEITQMSKQNAANAQQARSMALSASEGAERGALSMQQLSAAVSTIKAHADQTAKIVKTIDDIAFQTNLLALNAAVEAARAGDSGKGFAVVAEEVRNLAMRSAEAAKTTARLIEESVKSSELGVRLNLEVSSHFDEITGKVKKVVDVMGEIAAASDHQSRGVQQINSAVDEMSRVTQHNAATTEQSAASAQELATQARSVREMVSAFKASDQSEAPSAPARFVANIARPKSGPRLRSVPPVRARSHR